MAFDIFNLQFTGNLTEDAVVTRFPEKEKAVINFSVATNLTKTETIFLSCNYWINLKKTTTTEAEAEKDLVTVFLEMLKKGKKITVFSQYATLKKSENEEKSTVYTNFNITVDKFVI